MPWALVTIAVAILAFFSGAAFASYGREHDEDDDDFEDEGPTREVEHG